MFSVTNLHNRHDKKLICHFINDSVDTLSDPVTLFPRKLFTTNWTGILLQRLHVLKKMGNIFVWDWPKIL